MKIELSRIYNNKPYYTITYKKGKISHALGYEQVEKFVREALRNKEKIELVETTFLEEHSKLVALLNSNKKQMSKTTHQRWVACKCHSPSGF